MMNTRNKSKKMLSTTYKGYKTPTKNNKGSASQGSNKTYPNKSTKASSPMPTSKKNNGSVHSSISSTTNNEENIPVIVSGIKEVKIFDMSDLKTRLTRYKNDPDSLSEGDSKPAADQLKLFFQHCCDLNTDEVEAMEYFGVKSLFHIWYYKSHLDVLESFIKNAPKEVHKKCITAWAVLHAILVKMVTTLESIGDILPVDQQTTNRFIKYFDNVFSRESFQETSNDFMGITYVETIFNEYHYLEKSILVTDNNADNTEIMQVSENNQAETANNKPTTSNDSINLL